MKTEKNRGRLETRTVRVYDNILDDANASKWNSVAALIVIDRTVLCKGLISAETAYFISDLTPGVGAKYFGQGIRKHWSIESFHYVKDMTFGEDDWKVKTGQAPENYSLLRNIAINAFRLHNMDCFQAAAEQCANNVPLMMNLLR